MKENRSKGKTLQDMATELGVSIATVSRSMQGSKKVRNETKTRVLKLAREWNYVPNQLASALRGKKSKVVGISIPSIAYSFNVSAIEGIDEVMASRGYKTLILQSHEHQRQEKENILYLLSQGVDGIIASLSAETSDLSHFQEVIHLGKPLVMIDRCTPSLNCSHVVIDNEEAVYKGTRHLIARGARHIAWLPGPKGLPIAGLRQRGYERALYEARIPMDRTLIQHCEFNKDLGFSSTLELLNKEKQVDAILAINDRIAIGAIAAVQHLGYRVPDDLLVVGLNDEPYARLVSPSLTSVRQPANEMGIEAGHMLLSQIEDPKENRLQRKLFNTQLIVRDSSVAG